MLTNCPECNKEVSTNAQSCPHCGNPKLNIATISASKKKNNNKKLLGVILILITGIIIFSPKKNTDTNSSSSVKKEWFEIIDNETAYAVARQFVEKKLKAPSTAEFPAYFQAKSHVKYLESQEYQIDSYVDSENSFGAMLRTNYTAKVKQHKKEKWILLDMDTY